MGGTKASGEGYPFHDEARRVAGAIEKSCSGTAKGCALAFSGGLDSSLLAHVLKEKEPRPYVCGAEGSADVAAARLAAKVLGFELTVVDLRDVRPHLRAIGGALGTDLLPIEATILIPFAAVCVSAGEGTIITGQGADELFGGYSRYLRKTPQDAAKEMESDFGRLLRRGAAFERELAAKTGKIALQPFLSKCVVEASKAAPEAHFRNGERKALLREAARILGLPEGLASAEKKAAQYGSGATRLVAKAARSHGLSVPEFISKSLKA